MTDVPPLCAAEARFGLKPTAFWEVQKLWTALYRVSTLVVSFERDAALRVDAHVLEATRGQYRA